MKHYKTIFREKKVCVMVPTYNNQCTLEDVLKGLLQYTDQIIVINDGSTDATSEIISRFNGLEVLSYSDNRGKGFALRQGLKRAHALGYDYAISIDSDGQHFPDDMPVFLAALDQHAGSVIIGERNMNQSSVPGKSNFGRNFSNFWFRVETGINLNDTQSGYRLYPVKQLNELHYITSKFEFEIEVLVRAAWAGIPVIEAPVKVYYPAKDERVSHFRPFRDFTRISILNTILVTITLLYIKPRDLIRGIKKKNFRKNLWENLFHPNQSDTLKAISVGFGVFMGIIPIWGFQLVVAIALALLFRLNKALVIIAANISIPPLIPFILFLSHVTGSIWMGDRAVSISFDESLTVDLLKNSLIQYVSGAITLAIISGVIFGLITFSVLRIFKKSSQPAR